MSESSGAGTTVSCLNRLVSSAHAEQAQVLDVRNPTNLVAVGSFDTPGYVDNAVVADKLVYLAEGTTGLVIVPSAPFVQFTLQVDGSSGVPFTIETASGLASTQIWTPLITTNSTRISFWYTDTDVKAPSKFYRVRTSNPLRRDLPLEQIPRP